MFELEAADARILVELAFTAFSHGLNDQADVIFAGVRAARPGDEAGFIGGALVQLGRGEIETAVTMLRSLPPTDAVRTFLAIALNRGGDQAEARDILNDVIDTAEGTPYANLARVLLDGFDQSSPSHGRQN